MTETQRQFLAEGAAAGLRYALAMPRRAAGTAGAVMGQRAGSSLEFRDYREYQPGDDLRHVDWSAYAPQRSALGEALPRGSHPRT